MQLIIKKKTRFNSIHNTKIYSLASPWKSVLSECILLRTKFKAYLFLETSLTSGAQTTINTDLTDPQSVPFFFISMINCVNLQLSHSQTFYPSPPHYLFHTSTIFLHFQHPVALVIYLLMHYGNCFCLSNEKKKRLKITILTRVKLFTKLTFPYPLSKTTWTI